MNETRPPFPQPGLPGRGRQPGSVSPARTRNKPGHERHEHHPGARAVRYRNRRRGRAPRLITNVRRLAGTGRPPGSVLITAATWLLALLDAGLLYVSFDAQYRYIFAVKSTRIPSMIEAAMLDAGMIILSALGIGLAMRGKPSKAERFLIMICSAASAGMNDAAADSGSWRSVVAYTAAPVFLAIITDRVTPVIRRHVLPGDTESAWAWLGHATIRTARLAALIALYVLRTVLAPRETASGLRRMVLDAAPVPARTDASAPAAPGEPEDEDHGQGQDVTTEEPAVEFATKKQAFLSRYRGHPHYGIREAAGRVAAELAPLAGLQPGTGRTYIAEELKRIDTAVAEHLAQENLAIAASQGDQR